jgi:fructose-bisphosphate aldolase class II
MTQMLKAADEGRYAIGAFNTNNMEIVQAILEAAEAENSPVIMQASQGAIKYAGLDYIMALVQVAASGRIPVALHLDHGTDFDQLIRCIRSGFSSVMYDGSKHSYADNIALTRQVIAIARPIGVSVEAEIGKIGGTEDQVSVSEKEARYTEPEEAKRFVDDTGVECLAIAIGTAHGQYKGEPKLDFDRLKKIKELIKIPIVLHGSSGVPDDALREAISLGVCKINIDTNIREAFVGAIREALAKDPEEIDPRKILGPGKAAAVELIREKIRVFGSSGHA